MKLGKQGISPIKDRTWARISFDLSLEPFVIITGAAFVGDLCMLYANRTETSEQLSALVAGYRRSPRSGTMEAGI